MKRCFIEISLEKAANLEWPDVCPLTGEKHPGDKIKLNQAVRQVKSSALVLGPLLGSKLHRISLKVPIAAPRAKLLRSLLVISWLLVIVAVVIPTLILTWIDPRFTKGNLIMLIASVALIVGLIGFIVRRKLCSGARITYVGPEFIDLAIKSEEYAKKFCELNQLTYEKRSFKIRIN